MYRGSIHVSEPPDDNTICPATHYVLCAWTEHRHTTFTGHRFPPSPIDRPLPEYKNIFMYSVGWIPILLPIIRLYWR